MKNNISKTIGGITGVTTGPAGTLEFSSEKRRYRVEPSEGLYILTDIESGMVVLPDASLDELSVAVRAFESCIKIVPKPQ